MVIKWGYPYDTKKIKYRISNIKLVLSNVKYKWIRAWFTDQIRDLYLNFYSN